MTTTGCCSVGSRLHIRRFPTGPKGVWSAPGGGVEPPENPLEALSRELCEETGLVLHDRPPHVWHQEVIGEGHGEDPCASGWGETPLLSSFPLHGAEKRDT